MTTQAQPGISQQNDVEATIKRISGHPGVQGLLVLMDDGTVIRSTFDDEMTSKYSKLVSTYTILSRSSIRDIDPANELNYVRIRSDKRELVCIPEGKYFIIVVTSMDAEFKP
ncbi:Dynein light chain [Giardia muris]|uniref:Dynein light chain n=1 Tax=Giardia muris TaxID=5742 RepID=A0A4Z1T0H4_GIAMU|nr:Dynein light chain [Giardia muris]|eukprot:TNJ30485.1 Dynein light chain [Giardia muris]